MESSATAGTVTEQLDHADLVFSVFFLVVFCPFVAAVFALVVVLELFNIQNNRPLVMDHDRDCEHVGARLAYSTRHGRNFFPVNAKHLFPF